MTVLQAVCCEDKVHCCPQDYTCDVKEGKCNPSKASMPYLRFDWTMHSRNVPMLKKLPAKKVSTYRGMHVTGFIAILLLYICFAYLLLQVDRLVYCKRRPSGTLYRYCYPVLYNKGGCCGGMLVNRSSD